MAVDKIADKAVEATTSVAKTGLGLVTGTAKVAWKYGLPVLGIAALVGALSVSGGLPTLAGYVSHAGSMTVGALTKGTALVSSKLAAGGAAAGVGAGTVPAVVSPTVVGSPFIGWN